MFFIDVTKDLILRGANNKALSPSEKAIARCERINWFLYRSDYLTGDKSWDTASCSVKQDIISGLVKYVLCLGAEKPILNISTTPYSRRTRFMV